jgi:hypothetical protein
MLSIFIRKRSPAHFKEFDRTFLTKISYTKNMIGNVAKVCTNNYHLLGIF